MIDLYYYTSPNARKIIIALEELGLEYRLQWTDISRGDQHTEAFRRINPNGKIPAVTDHDGPGGQPITLFESGAILEYLADKAGGLLPEDPVRRWEARCWVYWQLANQGPMAGQAAHFVTHAANPGIHDEYARSRYVGEATRCYAVMDGVLAEREYLAWEYSIADIACFPWTRIAKGHGIDVSDFPNVERWSQAISQRPAAQVKPPDLRDDDAREHRYSDEQWNVLFGPHAGDGGSADDA